MITSLTDSSVAPRLRACFSSFSISSVVTPSSSESVVKFSAMYSVRASFAAFEIPARAAVNPATPASTNPTGPSKTANAALNAPTAKVAPVIIGMPAATTAMNIFTGPGSPATTFMNAAPASKTLRKTGARPSDNDNCAASAAEVNISKLPARVSFWIAYASDAEFVPVTAAVYSSIPSFPALRSVSICGPARVPNASSTCPVSSPASPSAPIISASVFVAGLSCSKVNPISTSFLVVGSVWLASDPRMFLNAVPACSPRKPASNNACIAPVVSSSDIPRLEATGPT